MHTPSQLVVWCKGCCLRDLRRITKFKHFSLQVDNVRPVPTSTGVDWRHKLETQRGAVLATELKNNANKLAKWTAAALVSGVEIIKLGYVSRAHQRDTRHHVILGTQVSAIMVSNVCRHTCDY